MSRPCSICTHPKRKAIEKALEKVTYRKIAERFSVSVTALSRHVSTCIQKEKVHEAAQAAVASQAPVAKEDQPRVPNAYAQLLDLKKKLELILEQNQQEKGQEWLTISTIKEIRGVIETSLKVWEAQKRIEAQYNTEAPLSATIIYKVLREKYPKVLKEVVAAIEEARRP
jgi:hypothetical protein